MDLTNAQWRKSSYSSGDGENGNCVEVAFWRKSSHSTGEGQNGDCVEVALWHKSSHSSGDGENGDCVEVGMAGPAVAVRDSKAPAAGALLVPTPAWQALQHRLAN